MAHAFVKVTAIVRMDCVGQVEAALRRIRLSGVSVSALKGYGEYTDLFARDWMDAYARFEILAGAERERQIVDAILGSASTGTRGDGIVCVSPVDRVWRVRSRALVAPGEI